MPPPTASSCSPSMMTPAPRKPASSLHSPDVLVERPGAARSQARWSRSAGRRRGGCCVGGWPMLSASEILGGVRGYLLHQATRERPRRRSGTWASPGWCRCHDRLADLGAELPAPGALGVAARARSPATAAESRARRRSRRGPRRSALRRLVRRAASRPVPSVLAPCTASPVALEGHVRQAVAQSASCCTWAWMARCRKRVVDRRHEQRSLPPRSSMRGQSPMRPRRQAEPPPMR